MIQALPCVCGSIRRGYLVALVTMIPFWMDSSSLGSPWRFHSPIWKKIRVRTNSPLKFDHALRSHETDQYFPLFTRNFERLRGWIFVRICLFVAWHVPEGEGGVLPYICHLGMCLLGLFSLKTSIFTLPIFVWKRVWFSRELRECMNVFIVSIPNEEERNGNVRIRNASEEIFCLRSNPSNHDIISA